MPSEPQTITLRKADGEWWAYNSRMRCIGRDTDKDNCKKKVIAFLHSTGQTVKEFKND